MTAPATKPTELRTCFAQVVVPVDFSPLSWRVLTLASRVSRAFAAPRHVVHVDTASPWLSEGAHSMVLESRTPNGPVEVDVVAARTPTDGVLLALGDDEASLLVMSTHGHTGAAELVVGSTAEHLLRRWHGPMLLAGPRFKLSPVPFRRIVLCLDPELMTTCDELMADVRAWAAKFDLPIEVLVVVDQSPLDNFDEVLRQNQRIEEAVAALSTDDDLARLVRLTGNKPGRDIARYVDSVDGTLVALPTHARAASARVVLGSTALSVLRHTSSPVLVRRFPTR